ncbi:MAG: tryptophan synthase subunit alpha [Terriglobia bacterium]
MPKTSTIQLDGVFQSAGAARAGRLIMYLTAGDPSLEATGELLSAIDRGGADVIELGVPFSDPMADGVVIQHASERALKGGTTLRKILHHLPAWRESVRVPIILFSYYNPILQYGVDRFASDLVQAGGQGALVVDLPPEEAGAYVSAMRKHKLDTIFLASPTSTDQRLELIAGLSSGFLYLISRPGVTGEQTSLSAAVPPLVQRVREFTHLPLAVGFGVSTPAQVGQILSIADAAVVGSALVRAIEEHYTQEGSQAIERFVSWLKSGIGSRPE